MAYKGSGTLPYNRRRKQRDVSCGSQCESLSAASEFLQQEMFSMKKLMLRALIPVLMVQGLFLASPTAAHAEDMTCPPPTPVTIDIKPGNSQNRIKLSSAGVLAVAVLTTDDFDATQFAPTMAHLNDANTAMAESCSGAAAQRWSLDDENGDGRLDLVFFFNIQDLTLTTSSTAATLMAHGAYGSTELHIEGTDSVQVVP